MSDTKLRDAVGQHIERGDYVVHITRQGSSVVKTLRVVEEINEDGTLALTPLEYGGKQGKVQPYNVVVTMEGNVKLDWV